MKRYRNVLFAAAGMTLLFVIACGNSPFSAEKGSAAIPVITVQPLGAAYNVGALAVVPLTVTASVSDGGTLSYEWYSNTRDSNKDGIKISGETEERYTPSTTNEGVVYYYVVVTNTLNGKTAAITSETAKVTVNAATAGAFTIIVDISGNETGDTVTASPNTGKAGDTITLAYAVANTKHYNLLDFGGVTVAITSVDSTGSGTKTYTINAADASSNGVITITAIFNHTDLEIGERETIAGWVGTATTGAIDSAIANTFGVGTGTLKLWRNGTWTVIMGSTGGNYQLTATSNNSANNIWWLVTLSTAGYVNIEVSYSMMSTNAGPRDIVVEYTVDNGTTWTRVQTHTLTSSIAVFPPYSLPNANNTNNLLIRWMIASEERADGTIGGANGNNRINNIVITGQPVF